MKIIKSTVYIIFIGLIISLMSCANTNRKLELEVSQAGIITIEQLINQYLEIDKIDYKQSYNSELIGVLKQNSDISTNLQQTNPETRKKITALRAVKQIYIEFGLLYDKNFADKKDKYALSIVQTCELFNDLELSSEIKDLSKKLINAVQSAKFDENIALHAVNEIVYLFWMAENKKFIYRINENFNQFQSKLNKVSPDVFDEEKLSKYVFEPYTGKEVLVNIYKLNLINEQQENNQKFIKKNDEITWALEVYKTALQEYLKKQKNKELIKINVNKIINLFEQQNENK